MSNTAAVAGRPWATAALVAGTALSAAAAYYLFWTRRSKPRRRQNDLGGPSLADEIREALQREAAEAGEDGEDADAFRDDLAEHFQEACGYASSEAASALSNDVKLALYGCYKQATVGNCPPSKPWGMESGLKWDAWKAHSGESPATAMRGYMAVLDKAVPGWELGAVAAPRKGDKGMDGGLGPCVSTMGNIGTQEEHDDVDETPIGQLCERIAASDVGAVEALLKKSPNLAFQRDKDGMSPLHWAADRGLVQVAALLLEASRLGQGDAAGSRINARDDVGDTPLHYAVNSENLELARMLVSAKADPNVANDDGETAMALAQGSPAWNAVLTSGGS
eukprot:TRINITY_DN34982_c0_g1_i1.p1 TRINITY_DN34982_c0_g1~~TRINITY_DN34982_c0_g1_i1.p1  ORF type:complete len:360 (-),score=70.24 TRINITY_DN34982_c0_g1_i1:277-1284(-)